MAERLKVTSVIKGLGPGGAERLLVEAAVAMADREIAPSVISVLASKEHLVGDLTSAGVDVRCLGVEHVLDPRWLVQLVRTLRSIRPDVVHVHSPLLATVVRLSARLRLLGLHRPAVVSTEHNAWPTYHLLTRVGNALTAPLDDVALAVSEEVRRSIRPKCVQRRVHTLRHGIDIEAVRALGQQRAELRASLGIEADEVVVVTVANYRAQKNYPSLLRAAAIVVAAQPAVRFVAVGQGPLAGEVERLHRELGLGDRFLLLGYRADAAAVLGIGDVFTLASDYEGLPVALMEALAHGLPVVATAVGGVAETIDESCGLLVAPRDTEALAAALLLLVGDPVRRQELAVGAIALGRSFDSRRMALTLEELYRTAVTRRRRRRRAAAPTS